VQSPPTYRWYYVGGVQKRGQSTAAAEWWWLTGGAIPLSMWASQEPNDYNPGENNQENVVVFDSDVTGMVDVSGMSGYGAVCECDGKSHDPTLAAELP
jgi:hypothetical protein